jgi:hypothetical protein
LRVEQDHKAHWDGIAQGYASQYDAIRMFAVVPRGFMSKWKARPSGNLLPDFSLTKQDRQLKGEIVMQLT